MCTSTLHTWDRCQCQVEHIKFCRPYINHTHKQIDNRRCWDFQDREHQHRDSCGASRSRRICRTYNPRYVREYSFETEEAFRVRQFKEAGKWEIKKDEGGGWRVGEGEREIDEAARRMEGLSAGKEAPEGEDVSPIKGREVKRVKKEVRDDEEEDVWKARERRFKDNQARREDKDGGRKENLKSASTETSTKKPQKIKDEPMDDEEQMGGDLQESEHKKSLAPINESHKIKEEPRDDEELMGNGLGGASDGHGSENELVHGKYGGEKCWEAINKQLDGLIGKGEEEKCLGMGAGELDMGDPEEMSDRVDGEHKEQEKNKAVMDEEDMIY